MWKKLAVMPKPSAGVGTPLTPGLLTLRQESQSPIGAPDCDFVNLQTYSSAAQTSEGGRLCDIPQVSMHKANAGSALTAPQMGKKRLPCARVSV